MECLGGVVAITGLSVDEAGNCDAVTRLAIADGTGTSNGNFGLSGRQREGQRDRGCTGHT